MWTVTASLGCATCGKHRVTRLFKLEGLRSQTIAVALACGTASLQLSPPITWNASLRWRGPSSVG